MMRSPRAKTHRPEAAEPAVAADPYAKQVADLVREIGAATTPNDFLLTDFTRLKGCSCKLPQARLHALLHVAANLRPEDAAKNGGVGLDCSIVPLKSATARRAALDLHLVSTTDFFFPSVEDPYLQGQIGAANVLSDLFALGVTDCDTVLMLLGASTEMEVEERDAVTREIVRGFLSKCQEADTEVTGGQSVMNPWPLIGGIAMSVAASDEMLRPGARPMLPGYTLVLTKPLGTQLAVNLRQWTKRPSPLYKQRIEGHLSTQAIDRMYELACASMAKLNRDGARMMMRHGAVACTDVTGFGILGHARNLAAAQAAPVVQITIETLPVLEGSVEGDDLLEGKYRLRQGLSAETSGGLLIAFADPATAEAYIAEMHSAHNTECWTVGVVRLRPSPTAPPAVVCDCPTLHAVSRI